MTGYEPRTSGDGSDRSTNWATITALFISNRIFISFYKHITQVNLSQRKTVINKQFD